MSLFLDWSRVLGSWILHRALSHSHAFASLVVLLLLSGPGCAVDELPDTQYGDEGGDTSPTDDGNGGTGTGGTGGTNGTGGGTDGTGGGYDDGGNDGPTGDDGGSADDGDSGDACEEELRRCEHRFTLMDDGYESVVLLGDFAPHGWVDGEPMTLADGVWNTTVLVPWSDPVQYKFELDGGDAHTHDPENPHTVDDGSGGLNSVLEASMCEDYTCVPDQEGEFDWRDAVIYFVFVDRFNNGDTSNDAPIGVEKPTDWQGGDWAGVTEKISAGYFNDLGVNTLWLSMPADNTDAQGIGTDGHYYSAFHGYWPTNLTEPEEHFGTWAELVELVETAHANDLKVIFDYAMNHVHEDSPVYQEHPDWFWPNDNGAGGNCVCGEGCDWNGNEGKRCWFTAYLPDFDFSVTAARDFSVDNAVQWVLDTGADGFRLDAVKHIEDEWLLQLREEISSEVQEQTKQHFYMVGETFTGDRDLIRYYVNPEMLDGQFDFPLRMNIVAHLIMRKGAMADLATFMDGNDSFYGAGIMSTFIGNHDIPRVIHMAEDIPLWDDEWHNGKDISWASPPSLPTEMSPFERVALGFTLIMTTPGAPLVYYGDEIGLPGAGDPDNRRFMQWTSLSAGQAMLQDHLASLGAIRNDHEALRYGTRKTLNADTDTFTFSMSYRGSTVYVALNRGDMPADASGLPTTSMTDLLSGSTVTGPRVTLDPRSAVILVEP